MAAGDDRLLLAGATLADGRTVDVAVRGERIEAVGPPGTLAPAGRTIDLSGHLLTPALVEPHAHLDKALTAGAVPNPSYDLGGAVTAWLGHRPTLTAEDVRRRATVALRTYLAHGVTALRSHVDVGETVGLRALEALLEVRDAAGAECDVQLVAFAGEPMTGVAGADNRALLRDALDAGADVAGGCAYRDPDPDGHHEACLAIAGAYGRPVDLHTDETLDPSVLTVRDLAERVLATGFDARVVASHCVSLGAQPADVAARVAGRMAEAGVAVVCLPQTNLYLQGRQAAGARPWPDPGTPPRALTALHALRAAGVTVAAGGDNLQDPFNCLGRGDPLETAGLLVLAGHDRPETAFAAVTGQARTALGLPPVAVVPGAPAELLAIRATSVRHAIATAAVDRLVIHRGRVVAAATLHREFPLAGAPLAGAHGDRGALLALDGVGAWFPDGTVALREVTLTLAAGEFVAVVGPSGCGKSTLLRIASGLLAPSAGTVSRATDQLGYVFQDPTLLPWRTVRRNVELVAELRGLPRDERRRRATEALHRVGLTEFADFRPRELSGGMRMRASLARALTLRPALFLFDEPFGAVDEITRARLGDDLQELFTTDRFGAVFVTHSVTEAVALADRVLVMSHRPGRIVAEVAVGFPHPRPEALRFTPEFTRTAAEVSARLRDADARAAR